MKLLLSPRWRIPERLRTILAVTIVAASLLSQHVIFAQITSSGLGTVVTTTGSVYEITGGSRPGNGTNLFHSFGEFSVPQLKTARFLNTTPEIATSNILGRVTGGNPSSIFGTIDTLTYPGANLFLMNPAGIVFGPTATLNVSGSVNFTTANYIRLFDGVNSANFYANPASDGLSNSVLAVAPIVNFGFLTPAAFGFLDASPAPITVQGSQLAVPEGHTLALVGGDVDIRSGLLPDGSIQSAYLAAPGGRIHIASVASAGEILANNVQPAPNIDGQVFSQFGTISISETSALDVSGESSGTIRIRGGQFVMDNSFFFAWSFGNFDGAASAVGIDAAGDVFIRNQSVIDATSFGAGRTGDIEIRAHNFGLTDGSIIAAQGFGGAAAGNISLVIGDTLSIAGTDSFGNGSLIITAGPSTGTGGSVMIKTSDMRVADQGTIRTEGGSELAGSVAINVENLTLSTGGSIQTFGSDLGPSGTINIRATRSINMNGNGDFSTRILSQNVGAGGTGAITIETDTLSLSNSAQILSETAMSPRGAEVPKVSITADSIAISGGSRLDITTLQGDIGALEVSARTITLADRGLIRTTTTSEGNSGSINITADNLTLSGGSQINSSTQGTNVTGRGGDLSIMVTDTLTVSGSFTDEFGRVTPTAIQSSTQFRSLGNAGQVSISAGTLDISDGALVASRSVSGATGNAGVVNIAVDNLIVQSGGRISTSTEGPGAGGIVNVRGLASPAQSITIDGTGSGLFTDTSNTGAGGNITTWSEQLRLTDGATISSKTTGQMPGAGDAGNILVKADDITISGGATITAASTGTGNAGTVTIQGTNSPAQSLLITGAGSGVFTTTSGTGTGGDILALSDSVLLTNGGTLSAATSGTRPSAVGGTVGVVAGTVRIENGGLVTAASSGPANGGDIAILAEQSVTVNSQGAVSTRATGAGDAGSIGIRAGGDFLSGGGSVSTTAAQGTGGDILVAAGQDIRLADQASLSANSSGPGDAGNITALAGDDFVMQNSSITTQAAQASGGNIKIGAQDQIVLQNSLISASVQGGSGSGGNISIDPTVVVLQNSQILAQAVLGNGGNITITTPLFFADQTSIVDASSQFGVNGTVTIQSPTSNLAGTVASLPSSMRQAQSLQTGRCAALANSQSSSFVVAGRETVPAEPGGWLPSPFASLNAGERLGAQDNGEGLEVSGHGQRMRDEDVSGLSRASDQRRATNHMLDRADSIDQGDQVVLSLRRLTPAGFLTQSFAESGSTGCRS